MLNGKVLRNIVLTLVVLCNIGCDQISKQIVRERIDYLERISVIGDIFTLTKIENEGAFLSFGDTLPYAIKLLLLTLLPIAALLYGIYIMYKRSNLSTLTILGIAFVLGGGIGNLYDRIRYGSVTDFMHIDFIVFQTGIFNIADVSIMIGMMLMIYNSYFSQSLSKKRQIQ